MSSMLPQHLQPSDPYLIDQLHFMLEQEETHYSCNDYLHPRAAVAPSEWRTLVSWSYDIVDACSIDREAAVLAVSYLNRFMCTSSPRARVALSSRREFQLAIVACVVIALKCRAGKQVDPDLVADSICQGLYKEAEIIRMERFVLGALVWRLNGPTPHDFVEGFVRLLPASAASNTEMVSGLTLKSRIRVEAAVLDYATALRPPSSIACAALLASMQDVGAADFGPLDRLAWMHSIYTITRKGIVSSPAANPVRNDWDAHDFSCKGRSPSVVDDSPVYCGEVSSATEVDFGYCGTPSSAAAMVHTESFDQFGVAVHGVFG